jgi:hypothetical protein
MSDTPNETTEADTILDDEKMRKQLNVKLQKLGSRNEQTMNQLKSRGATPHPVEMTRLRLEVLISAILGDQSDARLQYEVMWQGALGNFLAESYGDQNMKKLHVPGRG